MTIKWKVFKIANCFLLLVFVLLLVLLINAAFKKENLQEFRLLSFVLLAGSIIIIANSIFNLYVLQAYYPSKFMNRVTKIFYLIITILYSVSLASLLALFVVGLTEELKQKSQDNTGIIVLFVLLPTFLIGLFVLFNQFTISKILRKNYANSLLKLIDEIGEE